MDRRAEREFSRLPSGVRARFFEVFDRLAEDPFRPRPGCDIRTLRGTKGARAVRVGPWRGVYVVIDGAILFTLFDLRKRAYA
ncbi:MAG TPA: hypothetical protein VGB42_05710 [Candidatus Thermoplasmatota archaeon]